MGAQVRGGDPRRQKCRQRGAGRDTAGSVKWGASGGMTGGLSLEVAAVTHTGGKGSLKEDLGGDTREQGSGENSSDAGQDAEPRSMGHL